jgi:TolB-like protein
VIYRFTDCVLDTERRELRRGGVLRRLEPQVFDLLHYLIRNRDRVVSKDDVLGAIWHRRIVSESVLSTRINAVRAAIGDDGAAQRVIRTHRRSGFRFVAAVYAADRGDRRFDAPPERPPWMLGGTPVVAVMPLRNASGEQRYDHLAEGLTDEIRTALSTFGWFAVLSGSLSLARDREQHMVRSGAPWLGAQYRLEGRLRLAEQRLRVGVQLTESASGLQIWSKRYDCDAAALFAEQDEIAGQIAKTVADLIYGTEAIRAGLKSPEHLSVWHSIVRALCLINTRGKAQVVAAERLLKRALLIDPKSAPVHSLLSFVIYLRVHLGWQARTQVLSIALGSARRALSLDPEEPWAHLALGYATIHEEPEQAIDILGHALKLDPKLAMAHYLSALAAAYAGRTDDAYRSADMAERLQGYDLLARGNASAIETVRATTSFVAGRYQEGIAFARAGISRSRRQTPAYRQLVLNAAFAGEIKTAAIALRILKAMAPDVRQWIDASSRFWTHREDAQKYAEAFRLAGLK